MRYPNTFVEDKLAFLRRMREPSPKDVKIVHEAMQTFFPFPWAIKAELESLERWHNVRYEKLAKVCLDTWHELGKLHDRIVHLLDDRPDLGLRSMEFKTKWFSEGKVPIPRDYLWQSFVVTAAVFRHTPLFGFVDELASEQISSTVELRLGILDVEFKGCVCPQSRLLELFGDEKDKIRRSAMLNILRVAFAPSEG